MKLLISFIAALMFLVSCSFAANNKIDVKDSTGLRTQKKSEVIVEYDRNVITDIINFNQIKFSEVADLFNKYRQMDMYDSSAFLNAYEQKILMMKLWTEENNSVIPSDSFKVKKIIILSGIGRMFNITSFRDSVTNKIAIYIPSYFLFHFNDAEYLKYAIDHECAHAIFDYLTSKSRLDEFNTYYNIINSAYPQDFKFFAEGGFMPGYTILGHPEESESELFASAYNIMKNKKLRIKSEEVIIAYILQIPELYIIYGVRNFVSKYIP